MTATRSTFSAILKEFYVGPVIDAINREMLVVEHFEKATLDWNGKQAIIPIHTARNTGVFVADEAGSFELAGRQSYSRLVVEAKYQYGRFQITGPAIASAANGGKAAFVGWMDAEMTNLKDDVKNQANKFCVSGGQVKGFINQRASRAECGSDAPGGAITVTAAAFNTSAAGVPANGSVLIKNDFDYTGDFAVFEEAGCVVTDARTWVPIVPFRTDTYQPSWYDNAGGPGVDWFVAGFNKTAGTISIAFGGAAGVSWSSVVKPGFVTAIALNPIQATCLLTGGGGATHNVGVDLSPSAAAGPLTNFQREPLGIYSNLAPGQGVSKATGALPGDNATSHYTVTRGSKFMDGQKTYTDGSAEIIRSMILSSVDGTGAIGVNTGLVDQGRVALTVARMQTAIDRVLLDGELINNTETDGAYGGGTGTGTTVSAAGGEVNLIMMSPQQRQRYVAALQANLSMSLNVGQSGPTQTGDAGILSVSYAGIAIKVSRAIDNGLIIFLKTDTWNLAELQSPGFADLDGEVLARVAGSDQFEGYYRWYWNLVCKKPNNNVIMTGFSL
jgi:hypothetical protein